MMTKVINHLSKALAISTAAITMVGLMGSLTWKVFQESTVSKAESDVSNAAIMMNQAQLVEYANQLAQERARLIAYQYQLEILMNQLYSGDKDALVRPMDSQLVTIKAAPVPSLLNSVQGNSNGS